jgi:hypothetical protein
MKPIVRKSLYWAPFLALGPITGPLVEGIVRNARKGETMLAGLYGVAVVATWVALTNMAVVATEMLQHTLS